MSLSLHADFEGAQLSPFFWTVDSSGTIWLGTSTLVRGQIHLGLQKPQHDERQKHQLRNMQVSNEIRAFVISMTALPGAQSSDEKTVFISPEEI